MPDLIDRLKSALADRYAIEREIGAGGMATVYLAEDLKLHRKVALKVLLLLAVLTGCRPSSQDGGRWELVHTLVGHTGRVSSVAFSPDGQTVVSGSWDGSIKVWDRMTGAEVATYHRHTALHWYRAIAYSPDGNRLVAASSDSTAKLLKASSGELIAVLAGHEGQVWSVAFAPDGTTLVTGGEDGTVRVWDALSGEHLSTIQAHSGQVASLAFSPNGTHMASGGGTDNTIKLWNAQTGELVATSPELSDWVYALVFTPDGRMLVSSGGDGYTSSSGASTAYDLSAP